MRRQRLRIGIIGVQPDRGWAMRAHIPALLALSNTFEIVGLANSSRESGVRAADALGIPRAFAGVEELVSAPEVDIVTVAVKVPHHLELTRAAIDAGKHVYCEWPLGNGLAEAEEMASLANRKNVIGVAGTQAVFAPEIDYLKQLVAEGFIGELLSTSLVGRGGPLQGGGAIPDRKNYGYLLDRSNGATLLTIPLGHTLAALESVLGDVTEVSAFVETRRPDAMVTQSGERLPVTAPDEVLVSGLLASGAPFSVHYTGGAARDGNGMLWQIHGTEGDIRVAAPSGHLQMVQLSLAGARGDDKLFRPLRVPESFRSGWPDDSEIGNVARAYAAMAGDLRDGGRLAPRFDDAVALHRVIAAIESAAQWGTRTVVQRSPSP